MPLRSRVRSWVASASVVLLAATGLLVAGAQAPGGDASRREQAWRANNVGVAYLEQYDYGRAAEQFGKALEIDPALTPARVNLAIAHLYAPDLEAAQREAEAAARLPDSPPHADFVLGLVARAENREEDAIAAFRRVLEADPDDVGALVNLGQLLLQQRAYAEAVQAFSSAVEREPYNVSALYNLAVAHTRAGDRARGAELMKRFQALRESGYGTTYSNVYLEQGRYAEAILSTGAEAGLVSKEAPALRFEAVAIEAAGAGPSGAATGLNAADVDGDGRADVVVVEGSRLRVLRQPWRGQDAQAQRAADVPVTGLDARGVAIADVDNDGRADLVAHGRQGLRLFRQAEARYDDVTKAAGLASALDVHAVALVDLDHDGDLDIVAGGDARDGGAARLEAWRNNGDGTFTELGATMFPQQAPARVRQVIATDVDMRRDIDLVVRTAEGAVHLWRNMRDGTFVDATGAFGLDALPAASVVAVGDVTKDGYPDIVVSAQGGTSAVAANNPRGRFAVEASDVIPAGASAMLLLDADADGLLDVVTAGPGGAAVARNVGDAWQQVPPSAAAGGGGGASGAAPASALVAVDARGDGRLGLVTLHDGGLVLWQPTGVEHPTLAVTLRAQVSNRSGIGAKVEMRAGSLWQMVETAASSPAATPADLVFGLGPRRQVDVVRVLWPAGIVQAEVQGDEAVRRVEVVELDRKPSSCPYLFTWNGERFEFVTDFLGGGEMGYQVAPGVFNTPDPEEYVRIRGDQLRPRDGYLELRVTNELEETLFLDGLSLVAVDHPADVDVYPREGLFAPPFPTFELFAARGVRPVAGARDNRGRDVRDALRAVDRKFVDGLPLLPIRGYAEPHDLVLDLGDAPARGTLLLLTGWTDYAFSSDNIAAAQAGYALQPPSLAVRDGSGAWQTVVEEVGVPVGRPQTVVVDLTDRFLSDDRTVRIRTSMRIYWDAAAVATRDATVEPVMTRLAAAEATLRWRGFSAAASDGEPLTFDYARVSSTSPWKQMPGRYTREGDVRPLLAAVDDRFVVARPGDEVALRFDARQLPPVREGWTRTYLLHADGFSKEMDINSASPDQAWPLPRHGMPGYPAGADVPPAPADVTTRGLTSADEADPDWVARYNTRVVGRQVPRLGGVTR